MKTEQEKAVTEEHLQQLRLAQVILDTLWMNRPTPTWCADYTGRNLREAERLVEENIAMHERSPVFDQEEVA